MLVSNVNELKLTRNKYTSLRDIDYEEDIPKVKLNSMKKGTYRVTKKACYYQGGLPIGDERYSLFEILR